MSLRTLILRRIPLYYIRPGQFFCLVVFVLFTQHVVFAESAESLIDDRCDHEKLMFEFEKRVLDPCRARADTCTKERTKHLGEDPDQARDSCLNRPLNLDSRFVGPCPAYLEEFESSGHKGDEWLLALTALRSSFNRLNERGIEIDSFQRHESVQNMRQLLTSDPDNLVALSYLRHLLDEDDEVERLLLKMKIHELDPDCPPSLFSLPYAIYGSVNSVVDNWLEGSGSGSELTGAELKDLIQHAQLILLDGYDTLITQNAFQGRLYWALESIYDPILGGMFENLLQINDRLQLGMREYAEQRRKTLVHRLSQEYDIDSEHSRSETLREMCNDYAFEIGLLDHCLALLDHYAHKDIEMALSTQTDWTQAAILVVNALSRDCAEHSNFLMFGDFWKNERRCLTEDYQSMATRLASLLDDFPQGNSTAERELFVAFLRLDQTSDEQYLRALALDSSVILYGARLCKRLLKRGYADTASNILAGIRNEEKSQLSDLELSLLESTIQSVYGGTYSNWLELPLQTFQPSSDTRQP